MHSDETKFDEGTIFITTETRFPQFLPYPVFLLGKEISMTAKAVYALLLNRSRLSQLNHWEDEQGWVFIIYPIEEIAKDMHRSRSSIKSAMRELESENLLEKKRTEFGRANHLYVKLPIKTETETFTAREQSINRLGNAPPYRLISDSRKGCFPPPNHNTESTYLNNQSIEPAKKSFGRYQNIWLSQSEYAALLSDFRENLDRYLEEISCYLAATGRTYKNYEAAIRSWILKDPKKKQIENHSCDWMEEDSL